MYPLDTSPNLTKKSKVPQFVQIYVCCT